MATSAKSWIPMRNVQKMNKMKKRSRTRGNRKKTQNSKKNRNRIRRRLGVADPARPFKILQMYTVQISTV
jgi:hypothetical protein